jgi:hypothetical protein
MTRPHTKRIHFTYTYIREYMKNTQKLHKRIHKYKKKEHKHQTKIYTTEYISYISKNTGTEKAQVRVRGCYK